MVLHMHAHVAHVGTFARRCCGCCRCRWSRRATWTMAQQSDRKKKWREVKHCVSVCETVKIYMNISLNLQVRDISWHLRCGAFPFRSFLTRCSFCFRSFFICQHETMWNMKHVESDFPTKKSDSFKNTTGHRESSHASAIARHWKGILQCKTARLQKLPISRTGQVTLPTVCLSLL